MVGLHAGFPPATVRWRPDRRGNTDRAETGDHIDPSHLANDDGSPLPPIRIEVGAHGPAVDLRREDLRRLACATGAFFRRIAVAPGDRVVTFLPTGLPLRQSIFGATPRP